jgi:septal ring factor EnvC (AmiA/AmiB activator)
MPYQRRAEVVLAEWREVERKLARETDPDSLDAEELRAEAARLRNEYQALIDAAIVAQPPEPPPFPHPA